MKTLISTTAVLMTMASLGAEYHWRGNAPVDAGNTGNWHDPANWTDADGNSVESYPMGTDDVAVFHGLAQAGRIRVNKAYPLNLKKIHFADGNTTFLVDVNASLHAAEMTFGPSATFGLMADNWDAFSQIADFVVGNRDALLAGGSVFRGGINYQNQAGGNWSSRRSLSIGEDGTVLTNQGKDYQEYIIQGNYEWDLPVALIMHAFGGRPGVRWNDNGELAFSVGSVISLSDQAFFGAYSDASQGVVNTAEEPLYFWPAHGEFTTMMNYFRPQVKAARFVQSGWGTTLLWDDHSSETCDYYVSAGTLQLGGELTSDALTGTTVGCKFGTGDIHVSWSGRLDVVAKDAHPGKKGGDIYMTSYNGLGQNFGKIVLHPDSPMTVKDVFVDGKNMRRGHLWGSSAAKALNPKVLVDDRLFEGAGTLFIPPRATVITLR